MNWDKALQIINVAALLVGAIYFVARVEASTQLLAEKLRAIDERLERHDHKPAHNEALQSISSLAGSVEGLLQITQIHQKEIDRLRGHHD